MKKMTYDAGTVCLTKFPYYDTNTCSRAFKSRPVVIIGKADYSDYTVLPISSVSISANIDPFYDVEIKSSQYPSLNLSKNVSYVRTHKQTTINEKDIVQTLGNVKAAYPDLFLTILEKVEQSSVKLIANAL